ncbi:MAG: metallophosphoesterase [Planctomycetota bacterium]|nr:metallophosphoesterase [Planctomycetota bacterium]
MAAQRTLTRRELLRWSAGSLLAAGLWPGALRAEGDGAAADFRFVVVNDLHYVDAACGRWLETVIARMKADQDQPAFCLLAGDLANDGTREQLAGVRDVFKTLGVPVCAVIGNHDWLGFDDRKPYEELFQKQLSYHFDHDGWLLLGLDTTDGQHWAKTAVQKPTLDWLDETLPKLDKKRPMIVFTHFPLGAGVQYRPANADDVLARFKEHNLRAVFCGHFHGFTERKVGDAVLTTNRCCALKRGNHDGTKEKGYFLCHVKDGNVERKFVEIKPA